MCIRDSQYIDASKLYAKFTSKRALVYLLLLVVPILLYIFRSVHWVVEVSIYGVVGGLGGALISEVIARFLISPFQVKKQYRAYKAAHQSATVALKEEGLYFTSRDGNGLLRWEHIFKWRENDEFILVYQNQRLYNIIPKIIESKEFQIDDLKRKLREHVGKDT